MKSDCRLDSAVFQLTPTRTRCDLVIIASGRSEKLASGLLEPFLAHLKTARDQIAKGGYSITLEADPEIDAIWFTKGTLERFVRFVSTPEVLERVTSIESERLQIEKAIAIQGNDNGLSCVEDHQRRSTECFEGCKSTVEADAEKAIVLYKPGQLHSPMSNGTTTQEENSKVKLLRVLENRQIALQKEQGMAFARAVVAGFDRDCMPHLVSFAECFGASRLMNACLQFMELWKRKHEIGHWLEVEAPEPISSQSEFSSFNASGIVLPGDSKKHNMESWPISTGHVNAENTGKADQRIPSDPQHPVGAHEYFQGQYHQPAYPSWPMHHPPGPPIFQPYPMQPMPYYQNYPVDGPYFHPPYPQVDDPGFYTPQRMGLKRHSMDNEDNIISSETMERSVPSARLHDDTNLHMTEFEKESHGHESQKQIGRSGNKSGVVVIRNLNYITSKNNELLGNESQSTSDVETEEDSMAMHSSSRGKKHKNSSSSSKKKEGYQNAIEYSDAYSKDETAYQQEADLGNWQVFQTFLLRAEEKARSNEKDISASEKDPPVRRKENETDPLLLKRDCGSVQERRKGWFDSTDGKASRPKQIASRDARFISEERISLTDSQLKEIEGGRGGHLRDTCDDFVIYGREKQVATNSSLDVLADCKYEHSNNLGNKSDNVTDDSFMVPLRSASQDQLRAVSRAAVDIESKFPSSVHRAEASSGRRRNQQSYEPDVITLIPKRGLESGSVYYDPEKDYGSQIPVKLKAKIQENASISFKEVKRLDIDKKKRVSQDGLEKRKDPLERKLTSTKLSSLAEAQQRAEKLRAFKADLQKVKKEKEEQEKRRLEALKLERQKRIAARSSRNATHSPSNQQQNKVRSAPKFSPSSYKGSKFSDSEPGYSSPFKKLPIRTNLVGEGDSKNTTKTSRLSGSSHGLNQSIPSSTKMKKGINDVTPKPLPASVQTKRFSDPNGNSSHRTSMSKLVSSGQVHRRSMPDVSQTKKMSAITQMEKGKSATLAGLRTSDSRQTTKAIRSSGSSHELHQSHSPFTRMRKGINNVSPKPLPASIQTKRLSDPSGSSSHLASMPKLVNSDQVRRRSMPDVSQIKKISAITQMDKSKSATMSDLRTKLPKVPSGAIKNRSSNNETLQRGPARKKLETIQVKRTNDKVPRISNSDEKLIIEKTVVMLENEVVPTLIPASKTMDVTDESRRDGRKEKSGLKLGYATTRAPPSIIVSAVANSADQNFDGRLNSCEVFIDYLKHEPRNFSTSAPVEKPYHTPCARATSSDDLATRNLACPESLPALEPETAMHVQSIKAQVSNSPDVDLVGQTHETCEKSRSKESKSFRKLLKFGRKSQSTASGEGSMDSDASPVNDLSRIAVSSNNAHTLKNLISQDDTYVGSTPTKVSRHFSLLSPFRSKGIEKKSPA